MYKVIVEGVEIQCESADEAIEIAGRLRGKPLAKDGSKGSPAGENGSRWTENRFKTFTTGLRDLQARMIRELIQNPDGIPDVTLRRALNLETNKALGASVAGLSKKAKKLGISLDDVLRSDKVPVNGEDVLEYKASPAFVKMAKDCGWK